MAKKVSEAEISELVEALRSVRDPRVVGRSKHLLIDILVLTVCAILCRAESITEIEEFGHDKFHWLSQYLSLPHGIPSHDTIARVLFLIDPAELEHQFTQWVKSMINGGLGSISIDGKTSKGTDKRFNAETRPLHVVSVYSHEFGLTLAQAEANSSGNAEGAAAIECLKTLDLKGVKVLADAGLNSKHVIKQITAQKGHYIVPIKSNHKSCFTELTELFSSNKIPQDIAESVDKHHGRREARACYLLQSSVMSERFREKWPGSKHVFAVVRWRSEKDKRFVVQKTGPDGKQTYVRNHGDYKDCESITYYVSSAKLTANEALEESRRHWGIENKVHWILDVAFREDNWTVRAKRLARNLSAVRRMALNIIRSNKSKGSIRIKMKRAGWNDDFLQELVFGSKF